MPLPRLGFIGFGEAAFSISMGLSEEGHGDILAFDQLQNDREKSKIINSRAKDAGIELCPSLTVLVANCDIIISSVTSEVALKVARETARFISTEHFYLDINSVSPKIKKEIALVIEKNSGARFIEAAVMAAVLPLKHKVPMNLCGPAVSEFIKIMKPYGLNFSNLGRDFGQASAIKMFRSIIVKGMEALLQESLLAASNYNVADAVLESVETTYSGIDWKQLAGYLLERTVLHGQRRAHEMEEVIETLEELEIEPIMAQAITDRIKSLANLNLTDTFENKSPGSYHVIIKEMKKKFL